MDLIVLRNVPKRSAGSDSSNSTEEHGVTNSRLISMDEVRRRWAKKQEARRALLTYTPQPA